jgi:hypothetical protein
MPDKNFPACQALPQNTCRIVWDAMTCPTPMSLGLQVPTSPFQMDPPPSPQQPPGSYSTLSGGGAPSLEHLASQQARHTSGFQGNPLAQCTHMLARACRVGLHLMNASAEPCQAMPCHATCAAMAAVAALCTSEIAVTPREHIRVGATSEGHKQVQATRRGSATRTSVCAMM